MIILYNCTNPSNNTVEQGILSFWFMSSFETLGNVKFYLFRFIRGCMKEGIMKQEQTHLLDGSQFSFRHHL
jgi:hypothetical protein